MPWRFCIQCVCSSSFFSPLMGERRGPGAVGLSGSANGDMNSGPEQPASVVVMVSGDAEAVVCGAPAVSIFQRNAQVARQRDAFKESN